jgi:hypothetical protein
VVSSHKNGNEASDSMKCREFPRLAKVLLTTQEGFCSTVQVTFGIYKNYVMLVDGIMLLKIGNLPILV